jgi:hypothetical protein
MDWTILTILLAPLVAGMITWYTHHMKLKLDNVVEELREIKAILERQRSPSEKP